MGSKATAAKLKYNRATYKRYEFTLRMDTLLQALVERYKEDPRHSFSELIKNCLCSHFGITLEQAELLYVQYRIGRDGEQIPNDLDKYLERLE